jgi:hypothetical protein
LAHEPLDPLAGTTDTLPEPQLVMNPRGTIGTAAGPVDVEDLTREHRVVPVPVPTPGTPATRRTPTSTPPSPDNTSRRAGRRNAGR